MNISLSPNESPATPYTIPAVQFDENEYLMDSRKIAARLEKDYQTPTLQLDSPLLPMVEEILPTILEPMRPIWMPLIPSNLLNPSSAEYFSRTREERLGKSLVDFKAEGAGEECWIAALPGMKALEELLGREGGPYLLGKTRELHSAIIMRI